MLAVPLSCVQLLNDQRIRASYATPNHTRVRFVPSRYPTPPATKTWFPLPGQGSDSLAHHLPKARWSEENNLFKEQKNTLGYVFVPKVDLISLLQKNK